MWVYEFTCVHFVILVTIGMLSGAAYVEMMLEKWGGGTPEEFAEACNKKYNRMRTMSAITAKRRAKNPPKTEVEYIKRMFG